MKNFSLLSAIAALCLLCLLSLSGCGDDDSSSAQTVEVGALLSLSGVEVDSGEVLASAAAMAETDTNQVLADNGSEMRIELAVADTKSDPQTALEQAMQLHERGIRVMVGPYLSTSAAHLLTWANENGVLLISPTSTAPYLAIADDNLYRLTPDDRHQAEALAERLIQDGVETLLPVWRRDVYGGQLAEGVRDAFAAGGGLALEGVAYDPHDAATDDVLADMRKELSKADGTVGILLVSLNEGVDLLNAVAGQRDFPAVNWYAGDGLVFSQRLKDDAVAAAFAAEKDMLFANFYDSQIESHDIYPVILEHLGSPLDTSALNVYDAVLLAGLTYHRAEGGGEASIDALKEALAGLSGAVSGVSGTIVFNEAGDRADDNNYGFWQLEKIGGTTYQWQQEK